MIQQDEQQEKEIMTYENMELGSLAEQARLKIQKYNDSKADLEALLNDLRSMRMVARSRKLNFDIYLDSQGRISPTRFTRTIEY